MLRQPDRSESLGGKRELREKIIDDFSASSSHLWKSADECPQFVCVLRGKTSLAASSFDFLKDGLTFVTLSRLAHNTNELYAETAIS